jgi:hypothetical protein
MNLPPTQPSEHHERYKNIKNLLSPYDRASAAVRLLWAYTLQFEAYRRLRHDGDQYVRLEHVHMSDGAQAVIGNVQTREHGRAQRETHMCSDRDEGDRAQMDGRMREHTSKPFAGLGERAAVSPSATRSEEKETDNGI